MPIRANWSSTTTLNKTCCASTGAVNASQAAGYRAYVVSGSGIFLLRENEPVRSKSNSATGLHKQTLITKCRGRSTDRPLLVQPAFRANGGSPALPGLAEPVWPADPIAVSSNHRLHCHPLALSASRVPSAPLRAPRLRNADAGQ